MKLKIILVLFTTFMSVTFAETIKCEKINCKANSMSPAGEQYCSLFSSFHFDLSTKSSFRTLVIDTDGRKNWYDGDFRFTSSDKIIGLSLDLNAVIKLDLKNEKGYLTMYRRDTEVVLSRFELACR